MSTDPVTLASGVTWSWNLMSDVRDMWSYPFMVNAFRAGTIAAVLSGVTGWFLVLRRQTFAAHTLSVVSFPGAAGAVLIGVSPVYGYFAFCIGAALVLAGLDRPAGRKQRGLTLGDGGSAALTGTVQALLLAFGFLFTALYHGLLDSVNAVLFGSFLGITNSQVTLLAVVAVVVLAALAAIGRPLMFASVDPSVAAARGVPVTALSTAFLVLLGAATAETAQITGALLVFTLLVTPAATAQVLCARPGAGIALSVGIAVAVTWAGLVVAYYSPYPLGFWITTFAFGAYVLARVASGLTQYAGRMQVEGAR